MSLSFRKVAILAKIEAVYGTDSVPVAATDGVLVRNFDIKPLDLGYAERSLVRAHFGQFSQLPTTVASKISFELELAGFGTAGPAVPTPGYDAVLRMCGLARTITAATKVEYNPISAAFDAGTIYFYKDGVLHKLLGVRGDATLSFKRNEIPVLKFEGTGLYGGTTDVALVTPTLTAYQQPLVFSKANTPTFSIAGYATACLESIEIMLKNELQYRNLVNCTEQVLLLDRKPEGSVEIEDTTVAAKDWWTSVRNVTLGSLQLIHGTVVGNKVQIDAPSVQLTNPQLSESDGLFHLSLGLRLLPSTGNDEVKLTIL